MARQPKSKAVRACATALCIEAALIPPTTWSPSIPAAANAPSTCSRSAGPMDAPSPVVPNAVTLEQSPSRHQRACAIRRGKSMPVPGRNGVARAAERPKRLLEVITPGPHWRLDGAGSGDRAQAERVTQGVGGGPGRVVGEV